MESNTQYIIDYLEGRLSEDERNRFEAQIKNSTLLSKEVEDIAFIWSTSSELKMQNQLDVERNWSEVSRKIKKNNAWERLWRYSKTTAAILLLPVLSAAIYFLVELESLSSNVQYSEVTSSHGTITKTILSDGTEVWLNSGSTLIYPQIFTRDRRIVKLVGEGYFKVSADTRNRFDVEIQNELIVSAYGTEFNINAQTKDSVVEVSLIEGNIEVKQINGKDVVNVAPQRLLAYHRVKGTMDIVDTNLYVKTAWKDGKIVFRRTSMAEVVQRLSAHFNVDIYLEDKELYSYEYSATFTTETLNEILQLLGRTAPIKYEMIEPQQSEKDQSFTKRVVVIKLRK